MQDTAYVVAIREECTDNEHFIYENIEPDSKYVHLKQTKLLRNAKHFDKYGAEVISKRVADWYEENYEDDYNWQLRVYKVKLSLDKTEPIYVQK